MGDNTIESRSQRFGTNMVLFTKYKLGNEVAANNEEEWIIPFNGRIVDVIIDAETAPAGSSSIYDVNINGTTIYTTQGNRPTLAADDTGYYSESGEPEVTALRVGDILSYDCDQIGSGTAATRVKVCIVVQAL